MAPHFIVITVVTSAFTVAKATRALLLSHSLKQCDLHLPPTRYISTTITFSYRYASAQSYTTCVERVCAPRPNSDRRTLPDYPNFASDRSLNAADDSLRAQDPAALSLVPMMYRVPQVKLSEHEQGEIDARRGGPQAVTTMQWGPGAGRPRKQLYVVSFKCSRVDVFYLLDNTGLMIHEGDMVIVEADRGQDLGTVQHAKVTPDAARILKKKYSEEQYKWLMMYSRNKDGGYNPNAQFQGETTTSTRLFPDAPPTMQGSIPRDNYNNLKPKAIKRLANDHEIRMLAEKEGNEAKAKRTCQQKVAHLRLQMEILDAEWQW